MEERKSKKLAWVKPILECIEIPRLTRGNCTSGSIPGAGSELCENGGTALGCVDGNDNFI